MEFSVGGADYGSVRAGAFMGRRIIQGTASKLSGSLKETGVMNEGSDDAELSLSLADAKVNYLSNIPPHR